MLDPNSTATIVGAGGAISALLGGYTVLYRGARLLTLVLIPLLFTVIEVPVLVMLEVLWFAMQAAFAIAGLIDGAAYAGEVGAFAIGALTIKLLATHRKPVPPTRVV